MFCLECWQLCQLPDPIEHCRICFNPLDGVKEICETCLKKPLLAVLRACVFDPNSPVHWISRDNLEGLAGFSLVQWQRLEWPLPDMIIPMPDKDSRRIGRTLADFMGVLFIEALTKDHRYKKILFPEQVILLFDVRNSLESSQKAIRSLAKAFPKKIFLLSLMPYAYLHS